MIAVLMTKRVAASIGLAVALAAGSALGRTGEDKFYQAYYLEHAIALALLKENNAGRFMTQISHGVAFGFWAVVQAVQAGDLSSWIPGAPPVKPGKTGALESILLNAAASHAESASAHERAGRTETAIQEWRHVFGDSFGR